VTDLDFPAGATPWLTAAEKPVTRLWKHRGGALSLDDLAPLLNERTALVQVSLVSFYNGHRIDFAPLRDLVRRLAPNAVLSVDVTQALGRVVTRLPGRGCDHLQHAQMDTRHPRRRYRRHAEKIRGTSHHQSRGLVSPRECLRRGSLSRSPA
jgi:hypothetical protein